MRLTGTCVKPNLDSLRRKSLMACDGSPSDMMAMLTLDALGTLPIISGRQQPDREAINAKLESAKTNLCLIWDIGLEAIPNQGKRHRELSRKMTYLESN